MNGGAKVVIQFETSPLLYILFCNVLIPSANTPAQADKYRRQE
jgi:hypothetical protein